MMFKVSSAARIIAQMCARHHPADVQLPECRQDAVWPADVQQPELHAPRSFGGFPARRDVVENEMDFRCGGRRVGRVMVGGVFGLCRGAGIAQSADRHCLCGAENRPTNAGYREIYDRLKRRQVLEELRAFLAPLRLPARAAGQDRGVRGRHHGAVPAAGAGHALLRVHQPVRTCRARRPRADRAGSVRPDRNLSGLLEAGRRADRSLRAARAARGRGCGVRHPASAGLGTRGVRRRQRR